MTACAAAISASAAALAACASASRVSAAEGGRLAWLKLHFRFSFVGFCELSGERRSGERQAGLLPERRDAGSAWVPMLTDAGMAGFGAGATIRMQRIARQSG